MTIKKKSNGKYQVRVYIGYDEITGKRQSKYATADTLQEAKMKESQLIIDVATGELVPKWNKPIKQKHYTFEEAYKEWFEIYSHQGLANSTVDKTAGYFKRHLLKPELFGDLYLERINRHDIQIRVNKFIPTMVKSKYILRYASQVFKYAVDSDHIVCNENPLDHIRMVKPKQANTREVKYYDEHQAKLFEAGINEYWSRRPDFVALYTLLLRTGARIGEILAIQWRNVNLAKAVIKLDSRISVRGNGVHEYVKGLKNGDGFRIVEIDDMTVKALRRWKVQQAQTSMLKGQPVANDTFLFSFSRGTVFKRLQAFNTWYNKNHTEQLPYLNVHGFRHTHASLLISNGMELKKVADRLGHKDISVTANVYADVTPKARREVADTFSAILESQQ